VIWTEVERAFYCLKPTNGAHCGRPKGHPDEHRVMDDDVVEDAVAYQDAREGEVWDTVRERIVADMPGYGFTGMQVNAVLEILDLPFLTPEEVKS
jgi:hypothetical protein